MSISTIKCNLLYFNETNKQTPLELICMPSAMPESISTLYKRCMQIPFRLPRTINFAVRGNNWNYILNHIRRQNSKQGAAGLNIDFLKFLWCFCRLLLAYSSKRPPSPYALKGRVHTILVRYVSSIISVAKNRQNIFISKPICCNVIFHHVHRMEISHGTMTGIC
jgi:hypothetical protein